MRDWHKLASGLYQHRTGRFFVIRVRECWRLPWEVAEAGRAGRPVLNGLPMCRTMREAMGLAERLASAPAGVPASAGPDG